MSGGMKWLLLSVLVSLSRGRVCRNSGNCSCELVSHMTWGLLCSSDSSSKVIARFNIDRLGFRMECDEASSWSEFGYQSTFSSMHVNVPPWTTITIKRCPLPDESFGIITERFGSKSAKYVTFTSHMNLTSTLTRQHLSMLPKLRVLTLSSNGLTELPPDVFRDLGKLLQLDLSFNEIVMLPHDIFHGLSRIWKIDLSQNAMKFVDWRLFDNCTFLTNLSLRGNRLTSLDHRTFHNINQRYNIDLDHIALGELLPDALQDAGSYGARTVFDISGNRFSMLPEKLFPWNNLTELTFNHNRGNLTTLPMDFLNNKTTLKKVILIRNNFTSLPESIFWGSVSVQSIDLHGNALSTLPENIFKDSTALISLNLSGNGLIYLPEGLFRTLSELRRLDLERNSIASLPENIFENLDSLIKLNLGFNKITSIHRTTFHKLPNIQLIRLSYNSIDLTEVFSLNLETFFHGPTIQEIFLDHNILTGWFFIKPLDYNLPSNLQLVDLSYNQISVVKVISPAIGSRDVEYDLRHNNLRWIDIFGRISSKMNILVDDNPLICDYKMYALLKYVHQNREPQSRENLKIILGNASCDEPYWMREKPVTSLRMETFTFRNDNDPYVRCAEGCECWWRLYDRTRIVDCASKNVEEMPEEIIEFVGKDVRDDGSILDFWVDGQIGWFDWRNTRVELDLANNSITEIPTLNGSRYEHVELLVLSHNNVSRLSFDMLPPRLKMLRLDHNNLRTLNATTVEAIMNSTSLKELNLTRNPWNCYGKTRNGLASLEEKFGKYVRYSFDMQPCLDSRQVTSSGKTDRLYISFARF